VGKGRAWERSCRGRWAHERGVRSTHGVNCTGSCSRNVYVKDGLVTWESQAVDYPSTGGDASHATDSVILARTAGASTPSSSSQLVWHGSTGHGYLSPPTSSFRSWPDLLTVLGSAGATPDQTSPREERPATYPGRSTLQRATHAIGSAQPRLLGDRTRLLRLRAASYGLPPMR
jgi:hypothetical protein